MLTVTPRAAHCTIADICLRTCTLRYDQLVGLGKASASRAMIPGSNSVCAGIFSGSSHASDLKIGTPVMGSALGLFGPVSVYCDRVR